MGFQVPRRTARVTFEEGHDYHGAEVVFLLDAPTAFLFEFQRAQKADTETAIRMFADSIIDSWNLEDDAGNALSADYEGAQTLPTVFLSALMERWVAEATAAPAPLGQPSSDTDGSVVPLTQTGS